ncbi:MAG: nitroreductase family protein [Lachnospiraceae bacterium]
MSDILEELKTRRSVRRFAKEPVPAELIDKVVEAGLYAPTGMGRQAPVILKITDRRTVQTLGLVNGKIMTGKEDVDAFYGAPAVLCVLAPKEDPTAVWDGSSVIANMLNEAASIGLGGCWIHRGKEQFETPEGQEILRRAGLDPAAFVGIDSVILGIPEGDLPAAAPRKTGRVYSID